MRRNGKRRRRRKRKQELFQVLTPARPPLCSLQGEVSGVHVAAAKGGEGGPRAGASKGERGEGVSAGGSSKTGWSLSALNLFPAPSFSSISGNDPRGATCTALSYSSHFSDLYFFFHPRLQWTSLTHLIIYIINSREMHL